VSGTVADISANCSDSFIHVSFSLYSVVMGRCMGRAIVGIFWRKILGGMQ
jgi:hypothetical protein